MNRVLTIVGLIAFATSLFTRAVDPIIPPIAHDLSRSRDLLSLLGPLDRRASAGSIEIPVGGDSAAATR